MGLSVNNKTELDCDERERVELSAELTCMCPGSSASLADSGKKLTFLPFACRHCSRIQDEPGFNTRGGCAGERMAERSELEVEVVVLLVVGVVLG